LEPLEGSTVKVNKIKFRRDNFEGNCIGVKLVIVKNRKSILLLVKMTIYRVLVSLHVTKLVYEIYKSFQWRPL
jgi:hypothetical protein